METARADGVGVLCDDAVMEILVRLPSESVLRCRAVCRRWRQITTDRSFLAAHSGRRRREMIVTTPSLTVSAVPVSLDATAARRGGSLCDAAERLDNGTASWSPLLYSLDGLLVFQQRPGLYVVCNPVTRRWTNLPALAPDPCFRAFPCGFYLHRPSGEYRLLCHGQHRSEDWSWDHYVYVDYHYILACGSGRRRRLSSRAPADRPVIMGYGHPVAHGETLYWFAFHPQGITTGKMLAFHTGSETFRLMSRPPTPGGGDRDRHQAGLLELDGSLCAATFTPATACLKIWCLQKDGDNDKPSSETWTLRLRMQVPAPTRVGSTFFFSRAISAAAVEDEGDTSSSSILIGDPYSPVVMFVDLQEKRVRKEIYFHCAPTFLVFRESLVPHDFFHQLPRCPDLRPIKFPD